MHGGDRLDEWGARFRAARGPRAKASVAWRSLRVNRYYLGQKLGHAPTRPEVARRVRASPRGGPAGRRRAGDPAMTTRSCSVAARTAWVERDGTVYAAPLPDGPPLRARRAGAAIWRALAEGGTLDEVTQRVADDVGSPAEVVAADVATFVAGLVDAGLVVRRTVPAVPAPSHD